MTEQTIKTFKGFDKDLKCRGFQYEVGKEFETNEKVRACESGFHACEHPLDVFNYYAPNESRFCETESSGILSNENDGDTKVASSKIKIKAEIGIPGLVKAAIEYTKSKTTSEKEKLNEDSYGASSATGYKGASSATGYCGASSATGYKGASSATGDYGASSATGYCGASSATGYKGASSTENATAVAVAWGYESKAKGVLGSYIVCAEWKQKKDYTWVLKGAKMVKVDGVKIKADTWYGLQAGKFVEV